MEATPESGLPQIHNYYIGDQFAKGVFSSFRFAYSKDRHKRCAVKIMVKKKIVGENRAKQIMYNETILAPLLCHPSILEVLEICDSDSQIFQFVEFAEHGDLLHLLRKSKLDTETSRKIVKELTAGVQYLHSRGICHRNLKLENLLLTEEHDLKICDFKAAVFTANGIITGNFGSYDYAAPETLRESSFDGFKADMWSCGVIIYALLTRRMPFKDVNEHFDFEGATVDFSIVPKKFQKLVKGLLSLDPNKRPTAEQCCNSEGTVPLSALKWDKKMAAENIAHVSLLSQVLGVPCTSLLSKLNSSEMNREKACVMLMMQMQISADTSTNQKSGFYVAPDMKRVVVEKVMRFPIPASTMFSLVHNYAVRSKSTINLPLSPAPSIVMLKDGVEMRLDYHCVDELENNQCMVILCAEEKSTALVSGLIAYVRAHIK